VEKRGKDLSEVWKTYLVVQDKVHTSI